MSHLNTLSLTQSFIFLDKEIEMIERGEGEAEQTPLYLSFLKWVAIYTVIYTKMSSNRWFIR